MIHPGENISNEGYPVIPAVSSFRGCKGQNIHSLSVESGEKVLVVGSASPNCCIFLKINRHITRVGRCAWVLNSVLILQHFSYSTTISVHSNHANHICVVSSSREKVKQEMGEKTATATDIHTPFHSFKYSINSKKKI